MILSSYIYFLTIYDYHFFKYFVEYIIRWGFFVLNLIVYLIFFCLTYCIDIITCFRIGTTDFTPISIEKHSRAKSPYMLDDIDTQNQAYCALRFNS